MKKLMFLLLGIFLILPFINAQVNNISNCNELQGVGGMLDESYRHYLVNDINCMGTNFNPIGNSSQYAFEGIFYGNGYVIYNLEIDRNLNNIGLFGVNKGTIKDVIIIGVDIYSNSSHSFITASGSIAGINQGTITNSYVEGGNVIGSFWVGGLVGYNFGLIANSYSAVNIYSYEEMGFCGGISAYSEGNPFDTASIFNSYSLSTVNCDFINNCLSAGDSKAIALSEGNVYDNQICTDGSPIGTGYSTANLKQFSLYNSLNWDIRSLPSTAKTIWYIDSGSDYPKLSPFNINEPDYFGYLNIFNPLYPTTSYQTINLDAIWDNFDNVTLSYYDNSLGFVEYTKIRTAGSTTEICSNGTLNTCLRYEHLNSQLQLRIKDNELQFYEVLTVTAENSDGVSTDYLIVRTEGEVCEVVTQYIYFPSSIFVAGSNNYNLEAYFDNAEYFTVSYYDNQLAQTITLSKDVTSQGSSCSDGIINVCINKIGTSDVSLSITSKGNDYVGTFTIKAINSCSQAQDQTIIYTSEEVTPETPPIRYVNLEPTYNLGYSGKTTFSIWAMYDNFDRVNVSWYDEILNQTITLSRIVGEPEIVSQGDLKVSLTGVLNPDDINLIIESLGLNKSTDITLTVINDYGYDEQYTTIITTNLITPFPTEDGVGQGFLKVVDFFTNIFPDKDSLTTRQKISYVFIVLLIVTLLTLFFGWDKESGVSKVALYIAGILDFFVVIYFISIGYISIGLLIVVFVIALALAWLRVRGA